MGIIEWPKVCPHCLSKHADIHAMIYSPGAAVGQKCDHAWHKGPGYQPEVLNLTDDDRVFLKQYNIRAY